MSTVWPLPSTAATQALGASLASAMTWGERDARVVFLSGELGAGKTTLTAAALQAVGVSDVVRSPSFSLVEIYEATQGQAIHIDLYRLVDPDELEHLAVREHLCGHTLVMIEWPERGGDRLPRPDLRVQMLTTPERQARIQAASNAGESWLARILEMSRI